MPRGDLTPVCDLDKVLCYRDAIKAWSRQLIDESNCDCFPPCNDVEYFIDYEEQNSAINLEKFANLSLQEK